MMKRSSHAGKSGNQKEHYVRQLGMLDYEPTVEAEPVFPSSDDFKKDYSVSSTGGKRPTSVTDSIMLPLKKYWIGILLTIIAGLIIVFVYNISRDMGSLEGGINEIRNTINSFQQNLDKIGDKVQEQEIKNREQDIRMDYLEKQIPPATQIPQTQK